MIVILMLVVEAQKLPDKLYDGKAPIKYINKEHWL